MKTHYCILLIILLVSFLGFSESKSQQKKVIEYFSQTGARLKSTHFINSNIGFVVGDKGTILKTTTGGAKWSPLVSGTLQDLYSVYFLDTNHGYVVGGNPQPIILKTTNGGINWVQKPFNSGMWLESVYFLNPNQGFAVGPMVLLHTNNGGESWVKQSDTAFLSNYLNSIFFTDSTNGYVVGSVLGSEDEGIVYKTIDGGNNWSCIFHTPGYILTSVHFNSTKIGCIVGWNRKTLNGAIFRTTNGGNDWQRFDSESYKVPSLFSVFFTSADTGFVAGQAILKTTDGGISWVEKYSLRGSYSVARGMYFPKPDTGYCVGDFGLILKTTDGGDSWSNQDSGTR